MVVQKKLLLSFPCLLPPLSTPTISQTWLVKEMFVSLVRLFALIRHLYSGLGLQSVINLVFDIIQDMGWIHIGLQSDIPFF